MKKHLVFTIGTRPEAIKSAPVINLCRKESSFKVTVISTGQHHSMFYQAMKPFEVKIDHDLQLMQPQQTLSSFTAQAISRLSIEFMRLKPDIVFVQGDTSTVLAAALAAFYLHIPVAHIEAGLRTYNYDNPFPEEANRRLTDQISTFHFCPTRQSKHNLIKENISSRSIFLSGNTIVDAMHHIKQGNHLSLPEKILPIPPDAQVILVTLHRRENHGPLLKKICRELLAFIENHPDVYIYFPVHLNPGVQSVVYSLLKHSRIILDNPIDYFQLLAVIKRCSLILTDSGGIQEEAPSFNTFVLVLRKVTERPESIEMGISALFNPASEGLSTCIKQHLHNNTKDKKGWNNPYGDGRAAERIRDYLLWYWKLQESKPSAFNDA